MRTGGCTILQDVNQPELQKCYASVTVLSNVYYAYWEYLCILKRVVDAAGQCRSIEMEVSIALLAQKNRSFWRSQIGRILWTDTHPQGLIA